MTVNLVMMADKIMTADEVMLAVKVTMPNEMIIAD
jgi:hypothetical protein